MPTPSRPSPEHSAEHSPEHAPEHGDGRPPRLPVGTAVVVAVLLIVPCLGLALVPLYSHEKPVVWGWPFFYWYQMVWVVITPILTYTAYLMIKRARSGR